MNVYIITEESGQCSNIQLTDNGGRYFTNAPEDIMAIGGGYFITEVTDKGKGNFEGVFKIADDVLFPYSSDGRDIRVELTDSQITGIVLNPETRPLMEWAYHVPNEKTSTGLVMWFKDFINDLMGESETEALLIKLGAIITRK